MEPSPGSNTGRGRKAYLAFGLEGTSADVFRHNLTLNGGRLESVSAGRRRRPDRSGFVTNYEVFHTDRAKDAVFERVRAAEFPDCPSRMGALFLFPDRASADRANAAWWSGNHVVLEAHIVEACRFGVFDTKHLDCGGNEFLAAARKYWSGEQTAIPLPEIVLEGTVQLCGFEPYARVLRGSSSVRTPSQEGDSHEKQGAVVQIHAQCRCQRPQCLK